MTLVQQELKEAKEVVATLLSDNPLKVGHNTTGMAITVLDSFSQLVNGETRNFFYKTDNGTKGPLIIERQRTFNLNDPIDLHNWNTLKADIALHPEMAEEIVLKDPIAEAEENLRLKRRRIQLQQIILDHEQDADWLAKVYRRVVGLADKITTSVLLEGLLEKAQADPDKFGKKEWFFETEYFPIESLLDLACERGALHRDNEFYKKPDGSIWAENRAKAVFQLQNDAAFRHHLTTAVSAPVSPAGIFDNDKTVEVTPDLAELINAVSVAEEVAPTREDGSVDPAFEENKRVAELETLLDTSITQNLFQEDPDSGKVFMADYQQEFNSRAEAIGWLKANQQVVDELKVMTAV